MTATDPPRSSELHRPAEVPWDADEWHLREWLCVDGRGGYACGNALDLPTRRYHSWLTVVHEVGGTGAGGRRRVRLLAGVDERVDCGDGEGDQPWSVVHWAGKPSPDVPKLARAFRHEPVPMWTWQEGDAGYERSLAMPAGRGAVVVRWRNTSRLPLELHVRPLLDFVDADALGRERPMDGAAAAAEVPQGADGVRGFLPVPGMPQLWLTWRGEGRFQDGACWYRNYHLAEEAARGYDAAADRWAPGALVFELPPGGEFTAAFAIDAPLADPHAAYDAEVARQQQRLEWAESTAADALTARLRRGVDAFFYRDAQERLGVLAGFPWFGEWGRDVFIALPGLSLAVDRPERCREVLLGALPFLRDGLLPNIYGATPADSRYNSADAALWFSLCVQRYQAVLAGGADAPGDDVAAATMVRDAFGAALQQIATAYFDGAELGLVVDAEGLLCAGTADLNATWMDAQTSRGPVTPRDGQPVEIVALWCSLLLHLGELYGGAWRKRAAAAGKAFVHRFWSEPGQRLFDRRLPDGRGDPTVRPNMVIAAALPRSPLTQKLRQGVVDAAAPLVTPRGLRTLAPDDRAYVGRYRGGPDERDGAYHQGTAWPWLGGFHVEAALRAAGAKKRAAVRARQIGWLQGFLSEVSRRGFDHVNEVFDGDLPQVPGGAFAQAWNTGELLRALRLCRDGAGGAGA